MIIGGVRVSRARLVGDPAFGLMRLPAARLPSRNQVTSVGASVSQISRAGKGGFLSRLGGLVGGLGGALIGGPVGAAISLGPALSRRLPAPGGVGFPGFPGLMRGLGGVGPRLGGFGGRMTKRGTMTMRRRPRMRVTNMRPLLRALRRVRGFERIARRVIHVTPHFRHRARRVGFARRTRRK